MLSARPMHLCSETLGLDVGLSHVYIAPDPGVFHGPRDGGFVVPAVPHGVLVNAEPPLGLVIGLDDQHQRTSLFRHFDHRTLGRHRADDRRVRTLKDLWPEYGQVDVEVLARMPVVFSGPRLRQNLLGFDQPALGFGERDPVAPVLVEVVGGPPSNTEDDPPVADVVQQCDLLGQPDRMMERHLHRRETDLHVPGTGDDCRCKSHWIDVSARAVYVVLTEPHPVEAKLLGQLRLTQRVSDHAVVGVRRG